MDFEVVAEGLQFPEGPIAMPDGSVVLVEIARGTLTQGLLLPAGTATDYATGRIERVNLATGAFERVYDSVNGNRLCWPNDMVFDRQGNIWFTDLGKHFARHRDISGLYYARPDGSQISEIAYGFVSLNGVGLTARSDRLLQRDGYRPHLCRHDLERWDHRLLAVRGVRARRLPDLLTTNICFGGADLRDAYITLSGTGRLVKARWPRPGLRLNFSA